jgi:predicted Rossmann fold flavoprotein
MAHSRPYDVVVIGGGAAGFFGALEIARLQPEWRIVILEKTSRLLAKVAISGGGRCNVTHHCLEPTPLSQHYPRGQRFLKKLFREFNAQDTIRWFEARGVALKVEADGRMFPVTDDSQTVINCFLREAEQRHVEIRTSCGVDRLDGNGPFTVHAGGELFTARKVLVAMGGHPKKEAYQWLMQRSLTIDTPIPSLFTFNDPSRKFADLMGVSVPDAVVKIAGTRFEQAGPLLITHWGLSGPAVIKLSAWAATELFARSYQFEILINWIHQTEEAARAFLLDYRQTHGRQLVANYPLFNLPTRLWLRLCHEAGLEERTPWAEVGWKSFNRFLEFLIRTPLSIRGKTTFKEEFVTCGGIALDEINSETMECKKLPGVFVAGEVLNIDGETGGFNFQAAWSTSVVAARAMAG